MYFVLVAKVVFYKKKLLIIIIIIIDGATFPSLVLESADKRKKGAQYSFRNLCNIIYKSLGVRLGGHC